MALPLESRYSRAINDRIKSVSAGGGWLRRVGGFTGPNGSGERTAETRRHAASNNKTNIQVTIFPHSRSLFFKSAAVTRN